MNIKEILDKIFYKNDKKTDERRISKLKTGIILFLGLIIISMIFSGPTTALSLETDHAEIDENTTNYIMKGTTEVGANVSCISEELNMSFTKLNVSSDGSFQYNLTIPKTVKNAKIRVDAVVENKSQNTISLTIERIEPKKEESKPTEDKTSNEDNNYITTDILNVKNVKLDKYTFDSPDNSEEGTFYVKLAKRSFIEIYFGTAADDAYDNYVKLSKSEASDHTKKATIGGFEGYLDTGYTGSGFVFVFKKDGKNYVIGDVDGDVKWNSFIEEDIGILLKEWANKS